MPGVTQEISTQPGSQGPFLWLFSKPSLSKEHEASWFSDQIRRSCRPQHSQIFQIQEVCLPSKVWGTQLRLRTVVYTNYILCPLLGCIYNLPSVNMGISDLTQCASLYNNYNCWSLYSNCFVLGRTLYKYRVRWQLFVWTIIQLFYEQ